MPSRADVGSPVAAAWQVEPAPPIVLEAKAVVGKPARPRSSPRLAVRGAIVHNIVSCLHHLCELEVEQEYYEQAIQSVSREGTPIPPSRVVVPSLYYRRRPHWPRARGKEGEGGRG